MPASGSSAALARVTVYVGLSKLAVALCAVTVAAASRSIAPGPVSPIVLAAIAGTYGAVGAALCLRGTGDPRCVELGAFLLLAGCEFGDALAVRGGPLGGVSWIAAHVRIDLLIPVFLWWFVRDFPARAEGGWRLLVPTRAAQAAMVAAGVLAVANLVVDLRALQGLPPVAAFDVLARGHAQGPYWLILFGFTVPAAPVLIARAVAGDSEDRRRVMRFVWALLAGLLPIAVDVVVRDALPTWRAAAGRPAVDAAVRTLVFAALLSVPFTTAYAVLVARVADLRVIMRAALRYALARYTVLGLASLPLLWVCWFLYTHRLLTVADLVSGRVALSLVAGVTVTGAALALRQRTLDHLDRTFFREQYDVQRILQDVMQSARSVTTSVGLAGALVAAVDRALHVDAITVLLRDPETAQYVPVSGAARALAGSSLLVRLLIASDEPLDVEPENPASVLRRLDETEQHWLADAGFRLLVPMRGAHGSLRGILALGDKKSELPYSRGDRQLLAAVGASCGLSFGHQPEPFRRDADGSGSTTAVDPPAVECGACARVLPSGTRACPCGGPVAAALVPAVLSGKFAVEARIGAGGVGIVYRARDLGLGRLVAIKTLPIVTRPEETWRLRREARAMALVSHAHLAMIYGLESWRGQPLLVVEYLAGGTLADRLRRGPLPLDDVIALGGTLATALGALHGERLLHRDLKPSNVGYTAGRVVKVLDFGLASLVAPEADSQSTTRSADPLAQHTGRGAGTPAYMAPEALRGDAPSAAFDLWSLAVLLVEGLIGRNPFHGESLIETVARVERHRSSDVVGWLSGQAPRVVEFFAAALDPAAATRPQCATEFAAALSRCGRLAS